MTSSDGQMFFLKVMAADGTEKLIGFPHNQLSAIVENAAMQMAHGRDKDGIKLATAFKTSSFEVGRGPLGELVLSLIVGELGKINFLLPSDMPDQLVTSLGVLTRKN